MQFEQGGGAPGGDFVALEQFNGGVLVLAAGDKYDLARVQDAADREVPLYRIGTVKVNTSLRIRSGPGTNYAITGKLKTGERVTLGAEDNGWGELQQGGWVCLQYIV